MTRNLAIKYGPRVLLATVTTLPMFAFAAGEVDVSAAVSGIASAGAAILLVIGALLALSVSVFGLGKAYAFVKRKAGA